MIVQISKGMVPHTYKELIRRIMTFEYKNLLLIKSPQNKVASNVVTTGKKEKQVRHIIYASGILQISQ